MSSNSQRAWVFLSVPDARQHGGNDGYRDDIPTIYQYDEYVPNYKQVSVGDIVLIRSGAGIVGIARIEAIPQWVGSRTFNRCPICKVTSIKARKSVSPVFRCHKCGSVFDNPVIEERECNKYQAEYGDTFVPLNLPLPAESAYINKGKQQSIRELVFSYVEQLIKKWDVNFMDRANDDDHGDLSPEEVELKNKMAELETLVNQLSDREYDLEILHMRVDAIFRSAWFELGPVFTELRQMRSYIATALEDLLRTDETLSRVRYASQTLDRTPGPYDLFDSLKPVSGTPDTGPDTTTKALYADIVKMIYMDTCDFDQDEDPDFIEDQKCHLMSRARRAFHDGTFNRLEDLLEEFKSELSYPDTGMEIGEQLVIAIRQIAFAQNRITGINTDEIRFKETIDYKLAMRFIDSEIIDEDGHLLPAIISSCLEELDSQTTDLRSGISDVAEQLLLLYGER